MSDFKREVWVTGIGIISALGLNYSDNIKNLKAGKSALRTLSDLNSIHDGQYMVGQIPFTNDELLINNEFSDEGNLNRTSLLAKIAFLECLNSANASGLTNQITLASATTVGGMAGTELRFQEILDEEFTPDGNFIDQMDCGNVARFLQTEFELGGSNFTLSTACSSASNAIMLGSRLIRSGKTKMVIAGGSDSLSKFVLNGFLSLKNVDKEACKPFDADRNGLNLGEGAAFLLLEDAKHASLRGQKPLAKISGYCNINETYHMTGSSPEGEGAAMAMQGALISAELNNSDLNFIHAHGTSTYDNDLAEGVAIRKVFGEKSKFASSKSYTGHTLAASGAISSVLSVGMMQEGFLFPSLNFQKAIPEAGILPQLLNEQNQEINHVMVNSFGFGGNNTSIIISRS